MSTTPGIDVSFWQNAIDWLQVAAAGYRFAAIRSTVGESYTDPRFAANWDNARKAGLLVTAYHLVRPDKSAVSQMNHFLNVIGTRKADFPLALDIEVTDGQTPAFISTLVRECLQILTTRTGRKPIIYTAKWFWDANLIASPDWSQYDLWVANYGALTPALPRDWTTWRFWQYTSQGTVPGVGSRFTDLNYFNGTPEQLIAYAGTTPPVGRLRARVTASSVNVRSGPNVNFQDVGDLTRGQDVNAITFTGKQAWVKIRPDAEQWVAFALEGEPFITLTPNQPTQGTTNFLMNVRSAPAATAPIVGRLAAGTKITVHGLVGRDVWLEISPGRWAALSFRGVTYMQLL
ncbi:MAG: GH25 family lysozyme [bacterium]|nr:GH25 family lysozyme [bacterium]